MAYPYFRPRKFSRSRVITAVVVLLFFMIVFQDKPRYEPPINGEYNSPANLKYEREQARQEGGDPARELGREAGEFAGNVKDTAVSFGEGLKDSLNSGNMR